MPPRFCASAGPAAAKAASSAQAAIIRCSCRLISSPIAEPGADIRLGRDTLSGRSRIRLALLPFQSSTSATRRAEPLPTGVLFVEPDVLPAIAVEDAVDHQCQPLHLRLPARSAAAVEYDRSGTVL